MADNQAPHQICGGCNGVLDSKEHDCLKAMTKRINRQRGDLHKLSQAVERQRNVVPHHNSFVSLVKRVQDLESYKISESTRLESLHRENDQLKKQNKYLMLALEDLGRMKNNSSSNSNNNNNNSSSNSNLDSSNNNTTMDSVSFNKDMDNSNGGSIREHKVSRSDKSLSNH